MDAEEYRAESRARWSSVAGGWGARRDRMRDATAPVTNRLVDTLDLEPGQTVLELACGPGEVGLRAAERVRPGGKLVATDASEEMIGLVLERVEALGLDDVEEWWDTSLDLSPMLGEIVGGLTPAERDDLREALDARLADFVRDDGSVSIPAATHVAAADA